MKHIWICSVCGRSADFRQPEKKDSDPYSELNEDKYCDHCDEIMYYDDAPVGEYIDPVKNVDFQELQRDFLKL